MRYHLLIFVFLCASFFSCNQEKDSGNMPTEIIIIDMENIQNENIQPTIEEPDENRQILFILDNIEGYYNVHDQSSGLTEYVAFIAIEENDLAIYKFNIINGHTICEEIIRFDLDTNTNSQNLLLTNGDYRFTALIGGARGPLHFIALIRQYERFEERLNFNLISKTIDEHLTKHTFDHQKQYVGVYQFNPLASYRTENEALLNAIESERGSTEQHIGTSALNFLYPLYDDVYEIIINIDEDGFLFIDDGLGNAIFPNQIDGKYCRTKVIDIDQRAILYSSVRVLEDFYLIYFLNGDIFHEISISINESGEWIEHIVALRNYWRNS